MNSSFKDKLNFTKISLRKNAGPLLIVLVFMLIGAVLICISLKTNTTFLWIFGGVFVLVALFMMLCTMPSSFLHYYEQAQTKKYGAYTTAKIVEKVENDVSYIDTVSNREIRIEEFQYVLTYHFEHNSIAYENTFLVAGKNCFNALTEGASIPIQFLRTDPNKATVRRRKLANELGLPLKECQ